MSSGANPLPGQIGWVDLTVPDAELVREFYQDVTGWRPTPVSMGDYDDYCMNTPAGETVAGICNGRGDNADIPAVWLAYIVVADLDESMRRCEARGGKILRQPKAGGPGRFCVMQDPAGAVAALYEARQQA